MSAGEDLFAKLDEIFVEQIAEAVERECGINDVLALARTCRRMNAIIAPKLGQFAIAGMLRKDRIFVQLCKREADLEQRRLDEEISRNLARSSYMRVNCGIFMSPLSMPGGWWH